MRSVLDIDDLVARQRFGLWLEGHAGLRTRRDAARFMDEVGLALRYNATSDLPLASMYRATQRHVPLPEDEKTAHARAFDLTNQLLARGEAIEICVIASRLALASAALMPAIFALRRTGGDPPLSDAARQSLEFITANEGASSGDVRRILNVAGQRRPDPADLALTELQLQLLVDRGPSSAPAPGAVFYLSKEGYPYRVFAEAHPEIVSASARLSRQNAASRLLSAYLSAAVFLPIRKLQTLFRLLLSGSEIESSVAELIESGRAERVRLGKADIIVSA
jgi:hypothetical protein